MIDSTQKMAFSAKPTGYFNVFATTTFYLVPHESFCRHILVPCTQVQSQLQKSLFQAYDWLHELQLACKVLNSQQLFLSPFVIEQSNRTPRC